jgi:20S proteasome alpha/beta subunit
VHSCIIAPASLLLPVLTDSYRLSLQVEYAIEAIKLGSTAVGLQTKDGTVLAVEKRLASPLLDPASVEKIAEVDTHIGAAMSGLVADARTLVDHARVEAQNHRFTYDEPIGVEPLTQGMFMKQLIVLCASLFYIQTD